MTALTCLCLGYAYGWRSSNKRHLAFWVGVGAGLDLDDDGHAGREAGQLVVDLHRHLIERHPRRVGRPRRTHRSGKCDSEQAGAEEEKTGNGYSEETVRSEIFMCHGMPPAARSCWLPSAIGSSRLAARLERSRLIAQSYVGTPPIPRGIGRPIRRFVLFAFDVSSSPTFNFQSNA